MPRALFVSLNATYPQLDTAGQQIDSAALRNCTTTSWNVGPRADGVTLLFGVYQNHVVSGYEVEHPLGDWPTVPAGAMGAGRRIVPVTRAIADVVSRTLALNPNLAGEIRYRDVVAGADGQLVFVNDREPTQEELDPDPLARSEQTERCARGAPRRTGPLTAAILAPVRRC